MLSKKPRIELTELDSIFFFLIGHVCGALERSGATREEAEAFTVDASSGDYDHALAVCRRWVVFDREPEEEEEEEEHES